MKLAPDLSDPLYQHAQPFAYPSSAVKFVCVLCRVFFSDRLAGENSAGGEVLPGTPLRMPNHPEYKAFQKVITQLPDIDAPYFFSLPDNIERSLQRTNSTSLIKQLRILSSNQAEAAKYDREKWRSQLGPLLDLWQAMTSSSPGIVSRKVGRDTSSSKSGAHTGAGPAATAGASKQSDPVDDFVLMECDLAGEHCGTVDASLAALKKVLFGSGLLTPVIQSIATALLNGMIPLDWQRLWEAGPEKPPAWLRDLVRRRLALLKWKQSLSKGGSAALLSNALSLADLFHPATFVNALRQQTARKLHRAIDQVKLICAWDRDARKLRQDCPLPCVLSQLLLQGAGFSGNGLQESSPEASELVPVPEVTIGFVPMQAGDSYAADSAVAVPVYLTPSREEFLMELSMPMSQSGDQDRWILTGLALFLSEED